MNNLQQFYQQVKYWEHSSDPIERLIYLNVVARLAKEESI